MSISNERIGIRYNPLNRIMDEKYKDGNFRHEIDRAVDDITEALLEEAIKKNE